MTLPHNLGSRPIVITGLGVITALGDRDRSWQRLLAGETALVHRQPFPDISPYPLAMVGETPVDLETLVFPVAWAALRDAALLTDKNGVEQVRCPLETGLVMGSSRGGQGLLERGRDRYLSQNNAQDNNSQSSHWFIEALHHSTLFALARELNIQGPLSAPMAACATGLWSIMQGVLLLRSRQCKQVLVVTAEAPITPLSLAGFSQMRALAQSGLYPFDIDRQGLALGEGAAAFVLECLDEDDNLYRRGAQNYGQILGLGFTADGTHLTAPDQTHRGMHQALCQCLGTHGKTAKSRRTSTASIGYVHAHGTGTRLNDVQEATVLQRWFPNKIPVSSTKGATGHTLGASGGLGLAWSLLTLRDQVLPPCVGLTNPAFDLNFVLPGEQRQPDDSLVAVLNLAFGFGGQNGAIAIGHPDGAIL